MRRCLLVAAMLSGSWLGSVDLAYASDKNAQVAKVLTESYNSSPSLDMKERAFYLNRLTEEAAKLPHEKTADWCDEQYRLFAKPNPRVLDEWTRIATLNNALKAWSYVDPKKAIERLGELALEPAPSYPGPSPTLPPEDLRADAAAVIFPKVWRAFGQSYLTTIETVAEQIGRTGEYPYRPMLFIMEEINRDLKSLKDEDGSPLKAEIDKIFFAALNAYQTKKNVEYANEDTEFFTMLEDAQFVVPEPLFKQSLNTFVQHLLENIGRPTPNYIGNAYTAKGSFHFTNRSALLLFRVFSLVSNSEPEWAQKLRDEHPDILAHAGDEVENFQQGIIEGPAKQWELDQLQQQESQKGTMAKIKVLKRTDPWAALQLVTNLDMRARVVSVSDILPKIIQADPSKAADVYSQQLEDLKQIEADGKPDVTARVALAKAAFYMGDATAFADFAIKAFDSGSALFRKGETIAVSRPGFADLTDLVEFCTRHGAIWILNRVRQLQNTDPMLEVYLLISAAKGIAEQASVVKTDWAGW